MAEIRVKSTGTIKLFESDNTSSVTIASPASLGADRTITLPDADVTLVSGTMSTGFAVTDITGQTALGATPADTDEFVLSDAGVLKRVDYSYIKGEDNKPVFWAYMGSNQDISDSTATTLQFNNTTIDTSSGFNTGTYKYVIPAGMGGNWFIRASINICYGNASNERIDLTLRRDSDVILRETRLYGYSDLGAYKNNVEASGIFNLSAAASLYVNAYQTTGDTQALDKYAGYTMFQGFRVSS